MSKVVKPREGLVTVRKHKAQDRTTEGGVIVPGQIQQTFFRGTVIDTGPGVITESGRRFGTEDLTPGTQVIVRHDRGLPLEAGGEDILIVNQADVVARVEDEPALQLTN